jgi:hypothetical protein
MSGIVLQVSLKSNSSSSSISMKVFFTVTAGADGKSSMLKLAGALSRKLPVEGGLTGGEQWRE